MTKEHNPLAYAAKKHVRKRNAETDKNLAALRNRVKRKRERIAELEKQEQERQKQEELEQKQSEKDADSPYVKYEKYFQYANDPAAFAKDILGITLWSKQKDLYDALHEGENKVLVAASHEVGKSYSLAALAISFFFSAPDSIVLLFAPSARQVEDVLFSNIRAMISSSELDASVLRGTTKPAAKIDERWFMRGISAVDANAIQGVHPAPGGRMLLIVDEAVGMDGQILETIINGLKNTGVMLVLCFNPTDVSSPVFQYWNSGDFKNIIISGMDHPNIVSYLEDPDAPQPIPGAIEGSHWIAEFKKHSDKVEPAFRKDTDIEFPPGSGDFWRPGPIAMSRYLGLWPLLSSDSFFNPSIIDRFLQRVFVGKDLDKRMQEQTEQHVFENVLQVGVDIARSGKDFSAISVRYKNEIVQHHRVNGYETTQLAQLVRDVCEELEATYGIDARDICLAIDVTGIGAGVVDTLIDDNYLVYPIHFSNSPDNPKLYANIRAELAGDLAELFKSFSIRLHTDLIEDYGHLIERQCLYCVYKINAKGQFLLIPKEIIKKTSGASPDDLDAISLACYDHLDGRLEVVVWE